MIKIDGTALSPLIRQDVRLMLIEPHIYSVYPDDEQKNSYDRMGRFYDVVICNRFYNRLVWGYSPTDYAALTEHALKSSPDGWLLDAGCGSLAFTDKTYAAYPVRPVVLLDQSLTLLKIAKARLIKLTGEVPANLVFFHGDVLQLPFQPQSFGAIISMNVLHVLQDIKRMLLELRNVLKDGGTIFFTTLIKNHRFADRYLNLMGKAGEAVPRDLDQLQSVFSELDMPIKHRIVGNMAFIHYG